MPKQAKWRKSINIYQKVCKCNMYVIAHMEKDNFLNKQGLSQNYFTRNRCVNYNKREFATKQRRMYLTTTMSKKGPPDNYRGNIYVIN